MAPALHSKRKFGQSSLPKAARPKKRIRKQKQYHSSSEDDNDTNASFAPVDLNDSDTENPGPLNPASATPTNKKTVGTRANKEASPSESDDASEESGDGDEGDSSEDDDEDNDAQLIGGETLTTSKRKPKSKRNDPNAFSTSISKILSTKLSQSARQDPVLSRSREVALSSSTAANEKLEQKALAQIRADKKKELDRGRVRDVLGLERGIAGDVAEEEKKFRRIAQRGVIQLFNAFHTAHVRAEQAAKEERKKGTVGMKSREEKINEMSKQGFLELIGGKKTVSTSQGA